MSTAESASGTGPGTLVFWYEFASTYSYVAALTIEREAVAAGVALAWRPFLLGPIFAKLGWSTSPFNLQPAKGRYMWRDLERLCARAGLPWRQPSVFPRNGLLAARVATLGVAEGWGAAFSKAVFQANFAEDREIAEPDTLRGILAALGQPADDILARAGAPEAKQRLRERTEEAQRLGIFGAPSFQAAGELFWGQDRLAEAVHWARRGRGKALLP